VNPAFPPIRPQLRAAALLFFFLFLLLGPLTATSDQSPAAVLPATPRRPAVGGAVACHPLLRSVSTGAGGHPHPRRPLLALLSTVLLCLLLLLLAPGPCCCCRPASCCSPLLLSAICYSAIMLTGSFLFSLCLLVSSSCYIFLYTS